MCVCVTRPLNIQLFFKNWKVDKQRRKVRESDLPSTVLLPAMTAIIRSRPDGGLKPGTPSWSLTWVAGVKVFGNSFHCLLRFISRKLDTSEVVKTYTLIWWLIKTYHNPGSYFYVFTKHMSGTRLNVTKQKRLWKTYLSRRWGQCFGNPKRSSFLVRLTSLPGAECRPPIAHTSCLARELSSA